MTTFSNIHELFSHSYSTTCKTIYLQHMFSNANTLFPKCVKHIQNRMMANAVHFCSNQIETEKLSRIFNNSIHSWLQFQLKADPSILFLVSLPNRQKRMASEWFSLETWIKEDRLVGKVEWQGWIRHSWRYFPSYIAREDIRCDVDENLWPNAGEREN